MFVLLEVDDEGVPDDDAVFASLLDARQNRDALNRAAEGDLEYRLFELREIE